MISVCMLADMAIQKPPALLQCTWTCGVALVLVLLQLHTTASQNNVFVEQPVSVVAPVGIQVVLNCSVITGYSVDWDIMRPDSVSPVSISDPRFVQALKNQGFEVLTSPSTSTSFLAVNGTEENNQTTVTCVAREEGSILASRGSTPSLLTFHGPPSAPYNLVAMENGLGSLNISWSFLTMENVVVEFTLVATNLNDSNTNIESGISEQNRILTIEDTASCDVYSFNVIARNAAGSYSSDNITSRFPSLPDTSAVETSLQHSLARTAEEVVLIITFNAATSCPDYPVMNYTLVLDNLLDDRKSRIRLEEMRGVVSMVVEGTLVENSRYSFHIVVTNKVGEAQSTTAQIVTSEVQAVVFTGQDGTYSIQCIYLSGSNASGCVYILVSMREGLGNITGSIEGNSSGGASIKVANIGCYSEVSAHANTTGALPVRTSINTDEECPIGEGTVVPTTSNTVPQCYSFTSVVLTSIISVIVTQEGRR